MKHLLATPLASLVVASSTQSACGNSSEASNTLTIENFKFGLDCPYLPGEMDRTKDSGWICVETDKIPITGQGTCRYNKEWVRCTWYGFEFTYKGAKPGQELSCVSTTSRIANFGNPEGIESRHSHRSEFKLTLPNTEGRFYNPQYTGFSAKAGQLETVTDTITCHAEGVEVFTQTYELLYAQLPKRHLNE